jgi:Holliday junction resolvasome RuvABC DNA-binding subunit
MISMDTKQFEELSRKMETLNRLTALNAITGKSLSEQVATLMGLGFKASEVASILAKPTNVITATISYLREKGRKSPRV